MTVALLFPQSGPNDRLVAARLPALLADPPTGGTRIWLDNARLVDGMGAVPRERAAVLVEAWRIARVADAGEAPPDGAVVLDLGGRTLLPGLIDAHAHVGVSFPMPAPANGAEPLARVLAAELREVLRMGITTRPAHGRSSSRTSTPRN